MKHGAWIVLLAAAILAPGGCGEAETRQPSVEDGDQSKREATGAQIDKNRAENASSAPEKPSGTDIAPDSHEKVMQDRVACAREFAEALEHAIDDQSVKLAAARLHALAEKIERLNWRAKSLPGLTNDQMRSMETKYKKDMDELSARVKSAIARLDLNPQWQSLLREPLEKIGYTRDVADSPTELTRAEHLKAFDSSKLPMFPGKAGTGDGSAALDLLVKEWEANGDTLKAQYEDDSPLTAGQRVAGIFVQFFEAGPPSSAALDALAPLRPRAYCQIEFHILAGIAMRQAEAILETDRPMAKRIATAVFTTGMWMFAKARRLPVKGMALIVALEGLDRLSNWSKEDKELSPAANAWFAAITAYQDLYNRKFDLVYSIETKEGGKQKNYGDLLRVCFEDQDLAWRIEATLSLGIAKFAPHRGRANDLAIRNAIERLKSDKEPLVANAAAIAEKVTSKDLLSY